MFPKFLLREDLPLFILNPPVIFMALRPCAGTGLSFFRLSASAALRADAPLGQRGEGGDFDSPPYTPLDSPTLP